MTTTERTPRRGYGWDDSPRPAPPTGVEREPDVVIHAPTDPDDDAPAPGRGRIAGWFTSLRFVHQSPGSLLDQIRWAREAAYTTARGPWRTANVLYARLWSVPALTVLYFVVWAYCTRLGRTLWALLLTLVCVPVLNGVPLLQVLVPDVLDISAWWADDDGIATCAS